LLDDATGIEHDDVIGRSHGRELVRDKEADPTLPTALACGGRVAREERVFGVRVQCGGGCVEHGEQRVGTQHSARKRDLLPLTGRELDASGPRGVQLGARPFGTVRARSCASAAASARRADETSPKWSGSASVTA
jgi:hypothetical protein